MSLAEADRTTPESPSRRTRTLVLVTGSGRSGTSLVSGLLQRLGCRIPTPEVPADATNPKGFAESQWVVDFHTHLLRKTRVAVSDARPGAWAHTAKAALEPETREQVRTFLREQFTQSDAVVIKDPRLTWFLPIWRQAAQELGAEAVAIVMLRHPAAVVASKTKYYAGGQSEASRAAGWVNQILFTERATRDMPRVFIPYQRLLEDWTTTLAAAAETLGITVVRDAPATAIRKAHEFIDVSLDRSKPDWEGLEVPESLRTLADAVWERASELAESGATDEKKLDALRAEYTRFYAEVESIAWSSIAAAQKPGVRPKPPSLPSPMRRLLRRIPPEVRHSIPRPLRRRLVRALGK